MVVFSQRVDLMISEVFSNCNYSLIFSVVIYRLDIIPMDKFKMHRSYTWNMSSALHDLHMAVAASNKAYFGFVEDRFRWCKKHGEGCKALTLKLTLVTSTCGIPTSLFCRRISSCLGCIFKQTTSMKWSAKCWANKFFKYYYLKCLTKNKSPILLREMYLAGVVIVGTKRGGVLPQL